jgi:hypothetical protein
MVTFHVVAKLDLTILVVDFRVVQMIENVFYAMFVFQRRSMHISKEASHMEDNVLSNVY